MRTQPPAPPVEAESAPEEPPAAARAEPALPASALERQQAAALAAFQQVALTAPSALQAMLGSRAADLWAFSAQLSRELRAEAAVEGSLTTVLEDGPIVFDKMLQLDRQAERYIQFFLAQQRSSQVGASGSAPVAATPRPRPPR